MFFLKDLPSRAMMEGYASKYDEMDADLVEAALLMMRQASLLIRRLEAYFAAHDLSQLRFLVLVVIDREPAAKLLTVSDVADRLDVSRPVVTRTLRALQEDGLISFRANDDDNRSRWVLLTPQGEARLVSVLPGYFNEIRAFMKLVSGAKPAYLR